MKDFTEIDLYFNIVYILYRFIGLEGRVFANGPGDLDSLPGCIILKN